jgi:hypothetical protein
LSDGSERLKKLIGKRFGLWRPADANVTILEGDTFLVTYPKSGTTWLRFLVGQAIVKQPLPGFNSLAKIIPVIHGMSDSQLMKVKPPRLIQSHGISSKYPQVVYLVRDPRDVAISMYFWQKKVGMLEKLGINPSLRAYLEDCFPENKQGFIGWNEHVDFWMNRAKVMEEHLLTLRYEDIKINPSRELRRVVDFIGLDVDDSTISNAVAWSQPEVMRRTESASKVETILPNFFLRWLNKKRIPFVRQAKSGGWREVFDDELRGIYWNKFGKQMEQFGYEKE